MLSKFYSRNVRAALNRKELREVKGSDKALRNNRVEPEPWLLGPIATASCEILLRQISGACPRLQFSSVAQSCPTLCNPMDCSTPGFPVRHQLLKLAQTHVHWVSDAIKQSHPLLTPSPAFSLSQHQGIFQVVSSLHQVAKVLEFQLQHQSFQCIFRTDFL